jgi:hypothetical protein
VVFRSRKTIMLRYALAIFVSAFLLFQVQPLIGRFILPWFGGGPSIWTSCMLFFQVLLLGGYLYAHLLSVRLKPRTQVVTHLSLLAISLVFLPIAPGNSWKPVGDQEPLLQILLLLLATVGGPYFLLSSTGPLMQKWFSQSFRDRSPYRLYALSNIGSLLALLSYPFAFEPWLTLRQQVWSWSVGYGVFVALAAWCAIRLWREHAVAGPQAATAASDSSVNQVSLAADARVQRPGIGAMLLWLGLAACGSAMLLATTNQLCIDVATVPFLWVLPLSIYLISFIICFDSPQWYDRRVYGLLLMACCPVACWVISEGANVNISKQVVIYSTVLFACCMTCHGELVSCRPHPKFLTQFYVLVSAGGALGGVFVAIVAPYTFHGYWEYHISLLACCAITLIAWCVQRVWQRTLSIEFWTWVTLVIAHFGLVWHFVHTPMIKSIKASDETMMLGIYTAVQFTGLLFAGVLSRRRGLLSAVWIVQSIAASGWLLGYALRFPQLLNSSMWIVLCVAALAFPILAAVVSWFFGIPAPPERRNYLVGAISLITGLICCWLLYEEWRQVSLMPDKASRWMYTIIMVMAAASPFIAAVRLWLFRPPDEDSRQLLFPGAVYPAVCGICGGLLYFRWIESWHAISLMSTTAAAVLMEWSSVGFRGAGRASLGFVFWVPCITLVLLLGNKLAEIVKSDNASSDTTQTVYTSRNFYGVLRVKHEASREEDDDFIPPKYSLTHGQIKHGFQFVDDYWKRQPTTYYGRDSGIGLAIAISRRTAQESDAHPLRVGVVGLGTGTIAAYGEDGDYFRFYDINPDVVRLSDKYFTYLKDSAARTEVVIGDARIVMERELVAGDSQQFDVLAIDAFSSDAIPVHLLTSECGDIYRQHLRPGGILAVHISNRFLDLNPVSRGLAEHLGWQAVRIENSKDDLTGVYSSTWVLLTSRRDFADHAEIQAAEEPWKDSERILHWTDDYSGLWQVLSF